MDTHQMPIRAALTLPENLARLQEILRSEAFPSRAAAARRVCDGFGLHDALGRRRETSCAAALRRLAADGLVTLPEGQRRGPRGRPAGLGHPVPPPSGVPDSAGRVAGLRVVLVEDDVHRRIWNELMEREHPRGAAFHAGCQIRYLIGSDHGWLGALGFSAASLRLKARDAWVGWDDAARTANLPLATCLSRFLIRPQVRCRNLASMVLSRALSRLGADFEARYGLRPLLCETFVDEAEHTGASLAASGWVRVGQSTGRGRFAGPDAAPGTPKAVWLRPLRRGWRRALGGTPPPPVQRMRPLACGDGLDRAQWAQNEFGEAPLGDRRLSKRLVRSASIMADSPGLPFTAAAQGDRAEIAGWHRLIDHPDESEDVTPDSILAAHRERTLRRMAAYGTALLVQDGSDLNFATHPECGGLGIIGRSPEASGGTLGLHMHTTLAVGSDGIPLGVARIGFDAPDGEPDDGRPEEESRPARWLRGLRDASAMAARLEGTRTVSVMDREADFFALFAERERLANIDIVVRAKHDRSLGEGVPKLFGDLRASPAGGRVEIGVERSSARRAARGQKASGLREARTAKAELRWGAYDLPAPAELKGQGPVRLSAVHVLEETDPGDGTRLEWILLTSMEVESRDDAMRILDLYGLRWRSGDWHRILKSGCKAEHLNLRSAERIERAVAVKAVIAWRLAAMVMMGRETPELPAEVLFPDIEIMALADAATDRRLPPPQDLGTAFILMATLGGYLKRRKGPPPGQTVIWRGYACLALTARTYERLLRMDKASLLYQRLRPDESCV